MEPVFSIAEAAALTEMDVKAVNKAIENGVVEPTGRTSTSRGRMLPLDELVCLQLENDLADSLRLPVRRAVIREAARRPKARDLPAGDSVVVRLAASRKRVADRIKRLKRARQMVVSDPEIMGGEPVFAGTRIPVYLIAGLVEQGTPIADILEGYPALTPDRVALAAIYAKATPRRGRPRKRPAPQRRTVVDLDP